MLVKNVQMQKNQLHEVSNEVKSLVIKVLELFGKVSQSEEQNEIFPKLLESLFGPNSFTHFSVKKN